MSFLCSRIPGHVKLSHSESFRASCLRQFLRLFFVFPILDALKNGYPGGLWNVRLSEPFDVFILVMRLQLWVWEEKERKKLTKVRYSYHQIVL